MAKQSNRRRKKNKKNQQKQVVAVKIVLLILIFVSLFWMISESASSLKNIFFDKNPYFTLDKYKISLSVEGELTNSEALRKQLNDVLADLERKSGGSINLFKCDLKLLRTELTRHNPQLKDVKITRVLPEGLKVVAIDRVPVARIMSLKGKMIDRDGYVIPPVNGLRHLPILIGIHNRENIVVGKETINKDVEKCLELLNHLAIVPYGNIFEIYIINCSNLEQLSMTLKGNDYLKPKSSILVPTNDVTGGLNRAAKIINERHYNNEPTSFIDATYEVNVPIR